MAHHGIFCLDCYDPNSHIVWNNSADELWWHTKRAVERYLNALARHRHLPPVRVSYGGANEKVIVGDCYSGTGGQSC